MAKKKIRVTRITKKDVRDILAQKKVKADKKKVMPGPWTKLDPEHPEHQVNVKIKITKGLIGDIHGIYSRDKRSEKGWYNIVFNITSKSIMKDVDEMGVDDYLAACEKSFSTEKNKKKYGTLVFLTLAVDGSQRDDRSRRFMSIHGKTNKKSIKGFAAVRKKVYKIL